MKVLGVVNGQITGKIPTLRSLWQREATIGCGAAWSNHERRQALHDRYAGTFIVSSRRGYSLDLKIKRLVEKLRRSVR